MLSAAMACACMNWPAVSITIKSFQTGRQSRFPLSLLSTSIGFFRRQPLRTQNPKKHGSCLPISRDFAPVQWIIFRFQFTSVLFCLFPTAGLGRGTQAAAIGQHAANPLGTTAAPPTHVVAVIAVAGMASVDGQHWALHCLWWIGAEHRTDWKIRAIWEGKTRKNGGAPPGRRYKIGTKF